MQNEVAGAPEYSLALRAGARLPDELTLCRVLSASSGHALTYLAENAARERVVVKEFLPRSLVGRAADGATVRPHTAQDEQQFARALRRFAREAELLAQLSHRHLARVQRVIDANGTAYAVLDRYAAQPLSEVVAESGAMPARESVELMVRVLDALAALHGEGIVHRDLSPDSILVDDARGPVLLALSAKRHVVGHGQELIAGYAALEQYGARDVGPWTDVYASGALLFHLLTGAAPPSPVERASGQMLDSLGGALADVSPAITRVLMRALALLPDQRPHGARELQRQLEAALASIGATTRAPAPRAAQPLSAPSVASPDDERGAALRLAEGGIVVPNEQAGGWRGWLGRLTTRRAAPDLTDDESMPPESPLAAPAVPTRVREAAPTLRAPVPEESVVPTQRVVELPTPAALVPAENGATLAALQDVLRSELEPTYEDRRGRLGRRSLVAAAVVVVLMLTAGITYAARSAAGGPRPKANPLAQNTPRQQGAPLIARAAAPDSHALRGDTSAAQLQSSRAHAAESSGRIDVPTSARPATLPEGARTVLGDRSLPDGHAAERRPQEAHGAAAAPEAGAGQTLVPVPAPSIQVAVPVSEPQLHFLPPTLIPDLRLHLTSGKAYTDQGQYEAARRAFRTALDQIDSALKRYTATDELRAMRRDLQAADADAAQACSAENEMRRTRGGKLLQCQ